MRYITHQAGVWHLYPATAYPDITDGQMPGGVETFAERIRPPIDRAFCGHYPSDDLRDEPGQCIYPVSQAGFDLEEFPRKVCACDECAELVRSGRLFTKEFLTERGLFVRLAGERWEYDTIRQVFLDHYDRQDDPCRCKECPDCGGLRVEVIVSTRTRISGRVPVIYVTGTCPDCDWRIEARVPEGWIAQRKQATP